MRKRGNNEGTILKRKTCKTCSKISSTSTNKELTLCNSCGNKLPHECTWVAQITVGVNSSTGKPKRRSFYGKARKEVVEKMNSALNEINKGLYSEPTKYLFEDWLDKWLVNNKGRLKASTYDSYESRIRVHIKADLGKIPLSKLQTHMVQEFYNNKLKNGRQDGKGGLSRRAVRHLHVILNLSLNQAVQEGLINSNVAKNAKPPKVVSSRVQPLTEEQLVSFIEYVANDKFYTAYLLVATTGLRRGELLGLCWDCVDLKNRRISVGRQLLALKEGIVLDSGTKSKLSKRSITLTEETIDSIKKHKETQDKIKDKLQNDYKDNNLVFARDDGSYLDPREFTKRFQRMLEKAGLPKFRFHDLRHTHASLLLSKNIHPKIVQERLGHSSINVTLDLYSHFSDGLQEKASESLEGLFTKREVSDS